VYLPRIVFSHDQLCVVVPRVTSKNELKILIVDDADNITNITSNVSFKEILVSKPMNYILITYELLLFIYVYRLFAPIEFFFNYGLCVIHKRR
jgi:hypothetical protein